MLQLFAPSQFGGMKGWYVFPLPNEFIPALTNMPGKDVQSAWFSRKWFFMFHPWLWSGLLPERKEFREGPQRAYCEMRRSRIESGRGWGFGVGGGGGKPLQRKVGGEEVTTHLAIRSIKDHALLPE